MARVTPETAAGSSHDLVSASGNGVPLRFQNQGLEIEGAQRPDDDLPPTFGTESLEAGIFPGVGRRGDAGGADGFCQLISGRIHGSDAPGARG